MKPLTLQEFTAQEFLVDAFVHQSHVWTMFYEKYRNQITDEQRWGVIKQLQGFMPVKTKQQWLVVDNIRKSFERDPAFKEIADFIKKCYPKIYKLGKI